MCSASHFTSTSLFSRSAYSSVCMQMPMEAQFKDCFAMRRGPMQRPSTAHEASVPYTRVMCDSLFRHFTGRLYRQVLKEGYTVVQEPVAAQIPSGPLMRSFMRISVPTVRHTEGAVLYVVSPQVVASGQSAMDACMNPKPRTPHPKC